MIWGYVISIGMTVISGVLVGFIKKLMDDNAALRENRRAEALGREKAIEEGIVCLLMLQLIGYHEKYMELGEIPSYAYDNWCRMYKAYRGLGGNGVVMHMNDDIEELKIKTRKG